jgi:uncharacterized protein (TIGR03790 family)
VIGIGSARIVRAGLTADQIALVVNRNVPESVELAKVYAQARQVPPDRIIELDLPAAEDLPFDDYDRVLAPEIRRQLRQRNLQEKVRCLVAFHGVPLRVRERTNSADEARELAEAQARFNEATAMVQRVAGELERQAASLEPSFAAQRAPPTAPGQSPDVGTIIEHLSRRIEHAARSIHTTAGRLDAGQRDARLADAKRTMQRLREPVAISRGAPATTPSTQGLDVAGLSPEELNVRRFDAGARGRLRELAAKDGALSLSKVLATQVEYLTPGAGESAVDSELALLWWPAYGRGQWQPNLLNWRNAAGVRGAPPTLLVARLDGPSPQHVRELIASSLRAEREGLTGKLVIDAGGAAKLDAERKNPVFWRFDQQFTDLANFARQRAPSMELVYDDKPDVIAAKTVSGVALYTGWYSVGNYVPPASSFAPGAVAYHVASFELQSLSNPGDRGWCRGLLSDGACATLGPVSEPYLHAFPNPAEFFPLLMTGKLTLAEVYWRTCPMTSWKMALIGDPLYTPLRNNPPVELADLPGDLAKAMGQP